MAQGRNISQADLNTAMNDWRQAIERYYPGWDSKTYCVPPVYFNRPNYTTGHVAGLRLLVQQPFAGVSSSQTLPLSQPSVAGQSVPCGQSAPASQSVRASQSAPSSQKTRPSHGQPTRPSGQQVRSSQPAVSAVQITPSSQPTPASQQAVSRLRGKRSASSKTAGHTMSPAKKPNAAASHTQTTPSSHSASNRKTSSQSASSQTASCQPASSQAADNQPSPLALRPFSGKPVPRLETDNREDFSQQHVLFNLQALGRKQSEPMFLISQLNYSDYLNQPAYAQVTKYFPRPDGLVGGDREGDFDFLLPHLRSGIALLELKSVGLHKPQPDAVVAKKVGQAAKQLDKSGRVVRYILQDIAPGVRIVKAVVLPYVTSQQLQRVLMTNSNLQQTVCATLDVPPDVNAAVRLCLCADQLSPQARPHDVTDHILTQLSGWFKRRVSAATDPTMTKQAYLDILARLVGPASTMAVHCITPPRVEVRTLGEAVSELGERLARVVLTPSQLSLLNRVDSLPRVCLVGPPGTGKTLVLVLVGLHWLRKGHDVVVLSTGRGRLAVSQVIKRQLEETVRQVPTPSAGTVRLCHYDLDDRQTDVEPAIQTLASLATNQNLHILMDEAGFYSTNAGPALRQLVPGLSACVSRLFLWAASMFHNNIASGLHVEPLTVPLRAAPVIVREVEPALGKLEDYLHLHGYTDSGVPSPSDGPTVIGLRHEGEQHDGLWPVACTQCGLEVAKILKDQLHVGRTGSSSQNLNSGSTTTSPPPLQYRDVLVLTWSDDFTDEERDDKGDVVTPASGFVTGLRCENIPVTVIGPREEPAEKERKLLDVAMAQTDQVTVSNWGSMQGLEKKVLVYLPARRKGDSKSDEQLEVYDLLWAVSRCSSQLVWVRVPRTPDTVTTCTA